MGIIAIPMAGVFEGLKTGFLDGLVGLAIGVLIGGFYCFVLLVPIRLAITKLELSDRQLSAKKLFGGLIVLFIIFACLVSSILAATWLPEVLNRHK